MTMGSLSFAGFDWGLSKALEHLGHDGTAEECASTGWGWGGGHIASESLAIWGRVDRRGPPPRRFSIEIRQLALHEVVAFNQTLALHKLRPWSQHAIA